MKKIGVFYGSTTGTTEAIAEQIGKLLDVAADDIKSVGACAPSDVADYDVLVLGTSTWGSGELEDSWYDFAAGLEEMDLEGKDIALFGCGDETMADTFCSAVGVLYDRLQGTKARFIAPYDVIGYSFEYSDAIKPDHVDAVGLLIDEVNHPDLTEGRLKGWTDAIKEAIK